MSKVKVRFHKSLQKLMNNNEEIELYVDSYVDIVTSCMSLFEEFDRFIKKYAIGNNTEFQELFFVVDNEVLTIDKSFTAPSKNKEIVLCPAVKGKNDTAFFLILGIALIAVALLVPGGGTATLFFAEAGAAGAVSVVSTTGLAALAAGGSLTALASIGLGLGFLFILSGLSVPPNLESPDSTDAGTRTTNDSFGALTNTTAQFVPVPLHYGDVRVAGQFISGSVNTISHGRDDIITVGSFFENTDTGGIELPIGATGLIDFVNGFYNLGSGELELSEIITETQAVTSSGLDVGSLTNTAHIIGPLLALMTTLNYTVVVEWEETQSSVAQDLIFTLGSVTGSLPEDYVIMQNIGGTHPNQIYFLEALDNDTNNRDVISDFSGDQYVDVGVNRLAVGIDATDIKAAVNGFGFLSGAHGAGTRTGTVTLTVGAFGGWHGATVGSKQQKIRKLTFYPVTFDEGTLEGYSLQ